MSVASPRPAHRSAYSHAVPPLRLRIPSTCRRCGYDRTGIGDAPCPECGGPATTGLRSLGTRELTHADTLALRRPRPSLLGLAALLVPPLLLVGVGVIAAVLLQRAGIPRHVGRLIVALAIVVGVAALLPRILTRVADLRRTRTGLAADLDAARVERLQLRAKRAIRLGMNVDDDTIVAGRALRPRSEAAASFVLLEGDGGTWAVLSPHAVQRLLAREPDACPRTLRIDRLPRSGEVVDVALEGDPVDVERSAAQVSRQKVASDIEIVHASDLDAMLGLIGRAPWASP